MCASGVLGWLPISSSLGGGDTRGSCWAAAHLSLAACALLSALSARALVVYIWWRGDVEVQGGVWCKHGSAGGGLMYKGGAVHVLYIEGWSLGTFSLLGRARDDSAGCAGPALLLHQVLVPASISDCARAVYDWMSARY